MASTGPAKKTTRPTAIIASRNAQAKNPSGSASPSASTSSEATAVAHASAPIPSASVSHSTSTPRISGTRRSRLVYTPPRRRVRLAISPLGCRTATAIERGPRIITPSTTAWPPNWRDGGGCCVMASAYDGRRAPPTAHRPRHDGVVIEAVGAWQGCRWLERLAYASPSAGSAASSAEASPVVASAGCSGCAACCVRA